MGLAHFGTNKRREVCDAAFAPKPNARELRQRAEKHRLLARQIADERAAQALRYVASREAAQANEMERLGDRDASGDTWQGTSR